MFDTSNLTCQLIETTGVIPEKRENHSSAVIRKRLFIYGGNGGKSNEIHCLDTNSFVWQSIATLRGDVPKARYKMSSFNFGDEFYLFGGMTGQGSNS